MSNLEAELKRIEDANAKRVARVKEKIRKRDETILKNFVDLIKQKRPDVYAEYWSLAESEYVKQLEAKSAKRAKPDDEKDSADVEDNSSAGDQQNVLSEAQNVFG